MKFGDLSALNSFRRVLLPLIFGVGVVGFGTDALAHRDGCHRWHSCPSDTGSYVCGDLGIFTYCPNQPSASASTPVFQPQPKIYSYAALEDIHQALGELSSLTVSEGVYVWKFNGQEVTIKPGQQTAVFGNFVVMLVGSPLLKEGKLFFPLANLDRVGCQVGPVDAAKLQVGLLCTGARQIDVSFQVW
ncbi:hypothetical protein [Deinococcus cellulosilyticus]|uniref:Uncharacterized protein n=1 Tax=Deinococcus cellulosilyticus (strain DSM 18568 / NBRC 106333 / KACC 11606 / 5516J-15) TaxID=1223518 RepID=A0A511NBG8_DEIC1|nr:hypothetical protein [Deinococcus cellulosilyticus]GEM50150.1 hypothetical protein DC3_57850 [Deinococcus cellulosilyticus NBRC 106333 = KACC 11606]